MRGEPYHLTCIIIPWRANNLQKVGRGANANLNEPGYNAVLCWLNVALDEKRYSQISLRKFAHTILVAPPLSPPRWGGERCVQISREGPTPEGEQGICLHSNYQLLSVPHQLTTNNYSLTTIRSPLPLTPLPSRGGEQLCHSYLHRLVRSIVNRVRHSRSRYLSA